MTDQAQKRSEAIERFLAEPEAMQHTPGSAFRAGHEAGYRDALADNAERVREAEAAKRLSDEWMARTYEEKAYRKRERDRADAAESALAEAREVAARNATDTQHLRQSAIQLETDLAEARATIERLDVRRREGRQLLRRMVKYAQEDRAVTPGCTRLERLTDQVKDYLARTEDPADILRTSEPSA